MNAKHKKQLMLRKIATSFILISFIILEINIPALAQTSTSTATTTPPRVVVEPSISTMTPASGNIGTVVTISGSGFTAGGNVVTLDEKVGATITSFSTTSIVFRIPERIRQDCAPGTSGCDSATEDIISGAYAVTVKNINGESDPRTFIVISTSSASSTDSRNEGEGSNLGGLVSFVATCAITSFAGNAAKGALSGIIGNATSWLKDKLGAKISGALGLSKEEVPVKDEKTRKSTEATVENTGLDTRKDVTISAKTSTGGGSILSGIAKDMFSAPSLDALAFCIGNELIHYITQSTIQWINSGFQGKPVFVENADAFFQNAADQEAGRFVNDLMAGSGIDVCEPFRVQLAVDSINSHTNTYQKKAQCTLSQIKNNYDGFMNSWGQGGLPGWFEVIQKPNNIYGARYQALNEMNRLKTERANTLQLELGWAKGYKSFKYCSVPKKADGSCPKGKETTGTPGQVIEHTINERIGSPQRRLEIADEFDELVSALVNALVKTAVNQILGGGNSSSGGSNSGNTNRGGGTYQNLTPTDTRSPTISITSPVTGSTASSTITVLANATDNVGVAGVQFRLDGANFGTEDRVAPFSIQFNTASTTNGVHSLVAVARDANGNNAVSGAVTITVFNPPR